MPTPVIRVNRYDELMIDICTSTFYLLRFYTLSRLEYCKEYTTFELTSCDPLAAFFCAPHSPLLLLPGPGENWGRGSGAFHQRDRRREWRYSTGGGLALYSDEDFGGNITVVGSKQDL